MATTKETANYTGSDTEGGITSSYELDDGVKLKVKYSFFGSIYDEDEEQMALAAMHQDTLTMGPQVAAFQNEFAAMCGVKHAFAVSNCTTAMHVATQVFDIKPGDEVIVTPNTFVATSLVILKEGARPVYADIDPKTFNIDPADIEARITDKTRAIYVVHYGVSCATWTRSWRSRASTGFMFSRTALILQTLPTKVARPDPLVTLAASVFIRSRT